ncbi:hypothetical protein TanjilG_02300 [Lupinus angustifolius]|uniref:SOSEKI DIX-like domain-containing protein n=1 Tax=Lupinus angustifolius TaxID=3871 RepID=A0A4P1QR13_LUPAN|nr:PREDICTED: uncharacterized protein LOC109334206 [Lupinus angustifolius]OIV92537.1 hypothetical protein TanjilG_02300 [Lupinus angustifolius]
MEAKNGEVRRLHIIYFLNHMGGHAEHPHLIRVLHLARNGVYLRDVKRWIGELRGKDLPEAFSWSYKRRYKSGYVWQDLLDDDLLTPICDNEYVLKGSQIHPTLFESHSPDVKKTSSDILAEKKSSQVQDSEKNQHQQQHHSLLEEQDQIQELKTDNPTKVSSEINQEPLVFSSDKSSISDEYDESSKVEEEKPLWTCKENFNEEINEKLENCSLPFLYHNLLSKKDNKDEQNKTDTADYSFSSASSSSSSSQSSFTKLRSNSARVSSAFRNWISCCTVETNDAALVLTNSSLNDVSKEPKNRPENKDQICKGDIFGGSAKCYGTTWNNQHQQEHGSRSCDERETNMRRKKLGDFMNQTTNIPPFRLPRCSQCGKCFKPEKMHKHMKSCRGMKAMRMFASSASEKTQINTF